jgi:MFS family permease
MAREPTRGELVVGVLTAALAMVATLPGRTHGLGLITEPLLAELQLDRVAYATMNFWATLIGAAFCLPVGWLIDKLGVRIVLTVVVLSLAGVTLGLSGIGPTDNVVSLFVPEVLAGGTIATAAVPVPLFILLTLTRGFGQSALSVVSLAIIGKLTGRKPGFAMGAYSFLLAVFFMLAFGVFKAFEEQTKADWRASWGLLGIGVLVFGLGAPFLVVRKRHGDTVTISEEPADNRPSSTLKEALGTWTFWVFALATSYYGLVVAGTSLFNQDILQDRGFDRDLFLTISILGPMVGLAGNLLCGLLTRWVRLGYLLAVALLVQGVAMMLFPYITTVPQVYAYAVALGVAGGFQTVLFFSVWGQTYGPKHLGKIQAAAQLCTVLASALGPVVLAVGKKAYGNYGPVVQMLAAVSFVLAVAALLVNRRRESLSGTENPS